MAGIELVSLLINLPVWPVIILKIVVNFRNQSSLVLFLEVMGAILSVLIIWVLTGVLVYQAIERIINGEHHVNADIMLIVAGCGVGVNIL